MTAKVFTIPSGTPFLPALVRALMSGNLPHPGSTPPDAIDMSGITVLLPTRRAERALAAACLSVTGKSAMLLPQIRAIGGADEDRLLIGSAASASRDLGSDSKAAFELPPPIGKTERLLVLTQLVLQWSQAMREASADETGMGFGAVPSAGARTPAQAATMARELAELMDLVEREGCSLEGIENIVPDTFSEHWQKSLKFLEIITKFWPAFLEERALLSPKDRDNKLILAEAERLRSNPPKGPVIVAGVTGSIPATVELMRAVCELEQGAIVLPALDLSLDDESWEAIAPNHPEHPDFGLKKLLEELGLARSSVECLPDSDAPATLQSREHFLSEAMRPTETTSQWHDWVETTDRAKIKDALDDVSLIEAANPQEEAEAIALIMREAAEHPDKTAALVTPDRLLARRVAIRLEAWGIRVDDSAGRPFAKTVPGAFLEVVINAIAKDFAPVPTMALLKHPLARFGLTARDVRFAARALELAAFRTTYIGSGLEGIDAALVRQRVEVESGDRRDIAAQRLWAEDWERANDLLRRLKETYAPLIEAYRSAETMPLCNLAALHARVAEAASNLTDEEREAGAEPQLYAKEAGAAAAGFFTELIELKEASPPIHARDYPDLYRGLIGTLPPVIPRVPKHPRLSIWGPMESQLLTADVVILGALNETTWPDTTDPGPWLNRPMRAELGLPSPEEEIGREARGFVSLLGANEVYLTRATKVDGVPSVPSRWLMRMNALLGGLDLADVLKPKQDWLAWARYRDHVAPGREAAKRPEPRPPLAARPRKISVSGIERWIANPYALYANEILKLKVLPQLGVEPDAALKGKILHDAMSRFTKKYSDALPAAAAEILTRFADDILQEHKSHPKIAAFWVPRFARFAEWFADTEEARRHGYERTLAEINGEMSFASTAGDFTLTARADRLDYGAAGLLITDYKTGTPPSRPEVESGKRPQLPLEAAIAKAGGFRNLEASDVSGLRYIHASGGNPPGEQKDITFKDRALAEVVEEVFAGVQELVARFDDEATPYAAVRRTGFSYDYDDYAHLARVAEWSQAEGNSGGSGSGEGGAAQ